MSQPSFVVDHPRKDEDFPFLVLGGYADFIVPGLYANAHGSIAGLGNIAPVRLHSPDLYHINKQLKSPLSTLWPDYSI